MADAQIGRRLGVLLAPALERLAPGAVLARERLREPAEGEVGDVIVGGVAPPPGNTLWEQRRFIAADDTLRRRLVPQAYGHHDPDQGEAQCTSPAVPRQGAGTDPETYPPCRLRPLPTALICC